MYALRNPVLWLLLSLLEAFSLHAQPAAPSNRVLNLDGAGAWVELPPAGFTNFHQATIEAWVRWRAFAPSARVFDFGARQREMYVGTAVAGIALSSTVMKFLVVDPAGSRRREDVYGAFRLNQWTHLAVVTGSGGVRVYVNGLLVATNHFAGSLSSLGTDNYYLGRHNYTRDPENTLDGQLDEVRLWSVMRTEEEIRANLFRRLTGREPGLAGLWNFDDPTQPGRDASTNRFDGKLVGNAQAVVAELSSPDALPLPSMIEGRVSDPDGTAVPAAQIAVASDQFFENRPNTPLPPWAGVGFSDADGRYRILVFAPPASVVVGGYTDAGELYGIRRNLVLVPGQRQEVDLELQGIVVVTGTLAAMDNTPLGGLPLGLAKPRSSPGEDPEFVGALTFTRENGEFRFHGTRPPGRYELLAMTHRGYVSLLDGQLIDFNPRQPLTNLTFHLAPLKKGRWRRSVWRRDCPTAGSAAFCLSPTAPSGWARTTAPRGSMEKSSRGGMCRRRFWMPPFMISKGTPKANSGRALAAGWSALTAANGLCSTPLKRASPPSWPPSPQPGTRRAESGSVRFPGCSDWTAGGLFRSVPRTARHWVKWTGCCRKPTGRCGSPPGAAVCFVGMEGRWNAYRPLLG
jgi:hypothetical protein